MSSIFRSQQQQQQQQQRESSCPFRPATIASITGRHAPNGGSVSDDPQLSKREIAFYLVALVAIITYSGYGFYITYGQNPTESLPVYMLKDGWLRDTVDIGAERLMDTVVENGNLLVTAAVGYLLLSKATLLLKPTFCHQIACAVFTLSLTANVISPETSLFLAALCLVVICLSYYSVLAVWLLAVAALYLTNLPEFFQRMTDALKFSEDELFAFSTIYGYLLCRLISLGHSLRRRQQQLELYSEAVPSFFEHIGNNLSFSMYYTFYMPYYWSGPILTYDMFLEQVEMRGHKVSIDKSTAASVVWRCFRLVLWFFVLLLIYHFFPVSAYLLSLSHLDEIVYKHLTFAMFLRGQNFMLEYVQFYGWPAVLAKLDGIQLLDWPSCISWIYSYSIMWRVFDRGLFAFLQSHIYVPLGGNRQGRLRQILATAACFAFICIFHGDTKSARAWVGLNAIQLFLEKFAAIVYENYLQDTVQRYLSVQNEKRLIGYAIAWNLTLSCGVTFFFLTEPSSSIILSELLLLRSESLHTPIWHMLVGHFAVYCAVQVGRFYASQALISHGTKVQ